MSDSKQMYSQCRCTPLCCDCEVLCVQWMATSIPAALCAGTTIGSAAVRGAQAIQRLTGTERYQELRPAVSRLEKTAAELRGPARLTTVRRWVAVLRCPSERLWAPSQEGVVMRECRHDRGIGLTI